MATNINDNNLKVVAITARKYYDHCRNRQSTYTTVTAEVVDLHLLFH